LQNRLAQGGERKIYLKADARAKYGDVEAVIECIKGAGIENIGLITTKEEFWVPISSSQKEQRPGAHHSRAFDTEN
jgi:hypothetical protein